jgi:proline iminopeptidase
MDDGVRLRTWTTGTAGGAPPVVLVHGGPGLWDYLEPVAQLLAPVTVVHRYDQRGCGGSDPSPVQTIARHVADLEELRRHSGHDAWIVMGHSFGATLAFVYAVAHPERTVALGYLSGVGVGDWRSAYRRERHRRMTDDQRGRLAALEAAPSRTRAEEVEFRTLSWFTDHADPVAGWEFARADAQTDMVINFEANRLLNAETRTWSDADVRAQARRLSMPCWFVHGRDDPRPAESVLDLARAVPRSAVHVVAAAGHQPWRERPREYRELLTGLVTALGGPAGQ